MKNREKIISILIILLFVVGVLIKAYYVHYTPTWVRQHDVIGFGADEGHAAYIEYILNNKSLPDFDPRTKWAFFQPPLHHILSAVMLGGSMALGINTGKAQENTQILPLLYMIGTMILTVLLYRKLTTYTDKKSKICDPGLFITLCVVAVHPIFTILSGSINNDALSLVLATWALYLAIVWYRDPVVIRIIPIAVTIGLSMMAKLTGGLVAVPIGTLMLVRFISDIKGQKDSFIKSILQYIIFGIIVAPLGLWWTIRNKIKWDMPANYIPGVGEQLPDSITMTKRLFDVRTLNPYAVVEGKNGSYSDFNVPLTLVKTSLFGEWDYSEYSGRLTYISWLLLIIAVVLIVLCLFATFYMTFSRNSKLSTEGRIVLFLTFITYLFAYMSFALSYRNFSAEDFRYGAICIVVEGLFLGLYYNDIKNKYIKFIISGTSILFAALSVLVYLAIGIKS